MTILEREERWPADSASTESIIFIDLFIDVLNLRCLFYLAGIAALHKGLTCSVKWTCPLGASGAQWIPQDAPRTEPCVLSSAETSPLSVWWESDGSTKCYDAGIEVQLTGLWLDTLSKMKRHACRLCFYFTDTFWLLREALWAGSNLAVKRLIQLSQFAICQINSNNIFTFKQVFGRFLKYLCFLFFMTGDLINLLRTVN